MNELSLIFTVVGALFAIALLVISVFFWLIGRAK